MTVRPRRFHAAPASAAGEAWGVWDSSDHVWAVEPTVTMTEYAAEDRADELQIDVTCRHKRQYRTKKVAAAVASRESAKSGVPLQHYHCELHHCFHIGTPPGWRKQNEARGTVRGDGRASPLGAAGGS